MRRNTVKCLQSWADELLSRADRVRNLIGSAHWLSDGHHKEDLVRDFLRRHLPTSLRVSRGFICPSEDNASVSPEIDILVSDTEAELPWFAEGGLAIVPVSSARAQIHVKTEFGHSELRDVLQATFRVYESCESHREPLTLWSGAIFFSRSKYESNEECSELFWSVLKAYLDESVDPKLRKYLPDCIAIVEGPIIIINKQPLLRGESIGINIKVFGCDKLSIAILLNHFYDSVAERGRTLTRRGEWVQLLQKQNYTVLGEQTLNVDAK